MVNRSEASKLERRKKKQLFNCSIDDAKSGKTYEVEVNEKIPGICRDHQKSPVVLNFLRLCDDLR